MAEATETNPLLEAALEHAARGWPVLPLHTALPGDKCSCRNDKCEDQGKHPRTRSGLRDASTDEATLRGWWRKWPDANVGMKTGMVGERCLAVIDIDPRSGGDEGFEDLEREFGKLPDTYTVHTGSGGRHLYFWSSVPIKTTSKIAPGVDTRGGRPNDEGQGYAVVAPSNHKSGRHYTIDVGQPEEPAELPAVWAAAINGRPKLRVVPSPSGDEPGAILDGALTGKGRKKALHSEGRAQRARGRMEPEIRANLTVLNETWCRPPLDPRDVERVIEHVLRVPPGRSPGFQPERVEVPAGFFARGDSVELASRLLTDLQADSPEAVIEDQGALWLYDPARGLWSEAPEERCYHVLKGYAGAPIGDGKRSVKLDASSIAGAIRCARLEARSAGFFAAPPSGAAFADGFVTVVDGALKLSEHAPEHRAQHGYAEPYAKVPATRWLRFLEEVWRDEADRSARIAFLQEWLGAAILGEATRHAVSLALLGESGSNGKSVLLSTVRALFPVGSVRAIEPHQWANGFYLAELAGVRLNVVNELPATEVQSAEVFKAVVSGDAVTAAHKHGKPFTFEPRAAHLFACNALPSTRDRSGGFWRRWAVLTFERRFTNADKEVGLAEVLAAERAGVLAWALEGAARLKQRGHFEMPPSSAEAVAEWRRNDDQVDTWVAERCFPVEAKGRAEALYADYALWAELAGHRKYARNKFLGELKRLGHARRDKQERWYALGLRMR